MPINRHAVSMFAYDQVPEQSVLTVQTLETVLAQDIGPLDVLIIDNGGSQLRTWEHFQMVRDLYMDREDDTRIHCVRHEQNISPLKLGNRALQYFWKMGHEKVLGVANDVMLPPNFYRLANEWPRGMVCGSACGNKDFSMVDTGNAVSDSTPMSAALIRRWFHDALVAKDGYFWDEGFFMYASDCDMAKRMAACGIRGIQLDIPYWHYGSASHLLDPNGQTQRNQADADRRYFESKWGHKVDDLEYGRSCGDINFKGVPLLVRAAGQG